MRDGRDGDLEAASRRLRSSCTHNDGRGCQFTTAPSYGTAATSEARRA